MTRLELFALSAFIDQLTDSCEYELNEEGARLDHIFVEECHAAGLNPIEVSHAAFGYFRFQAAMQAVDFASQWNPSRTPAASLSEAIRNRAQSRAGETI